MDLVFLKPLVARVLRDPNAEWTVQGFGFLRTYFGPPGTPKKFRLNLWDSRVAIPNVSTIHDHPWDFTSVIVSGFFCNVRYDMGRLAPSLHEATHQFSTITTGVESNLDRSPAERCKLTARKPELYKPGDIYAQEANEIHETFYVDGSVTLNERIGDTEHARVFWPVGLDWVDAKPRSATPVEVAAITENALRGF